MTRFATGPEAKTTWDARGHLRAEMTRVVGMLQGQLARQRQRGRSPAGDAVQGFVIEDGEAEGLVADLRERWDGAGLPGRRDDPQQTIAREEVAGRAARAAGAGASLPLWRAAERFELCPAAYDAMLLALAVEVDARFGRLVAYLNDHVGRTRPTLGLALSPEPGGEPPLSPLALLDHPAVRDGLLEVEGDGPVPGLALRVARDVAARLTGDVPPTLSPAGVRLFPPEPVLLARLILDEPVRQQLAAWARPTGERPRSNGRPGGGGAPPAEDANAPGHGPARPLLLIGVAGAGRTTSARAAASGAGLPLVAVDVPALSGNALAERLRVARREARWHAAALLLRVAPGPAAPPGGAVGSDWAGFWTELAGCPFPLIVAAPAGMAEELIATAPVEPVVVRLEEPVLSARAELWGAMLPSGTKLPQDVLDRLASRFRFNPGRIAQAIRRALAAASLAPPAEGGPTPAALEQACRDVGSAAVGPLAQKLPLPYEWDELVVPKQVREELDLALAWARHQRQVLDVWGFARRVPTGRGLTMLFGGPPGTGKTMAAQVLARALGLDLYRVDLSRVMNKYIGETEKNLARLFDEAQASGAALFFDEADALFGKRSEVKDAHDRYANVEIGYLLQRMEEYEGVTMLASNRARDMDEAFTRRFQFMIDFPLPDEAHRLRIWEGMLPASAERDPDLGLAGLARDFEVSGGEIKNACLAAAYLAAGGARPIGTRDVRHALRREFSKNGRVLNPGA